MRRLKRPLGIASVVVLAGAVLLALCIAFPRPRAALVSTAATYYVWQLGYHLSGGHFTVNRESLHVDDLVIKDDNGEAILIAKQLAVAFEPSGLFGRSDRRFGLRSVSLEEPVLRLIRRSDGSWNISRAARNTGAGPANSAKPFHLRIEVRNGRLNVVDPQAAGAPGKSFSVARIAADVSLDQGARSNGTVSALVQTAQGDAATRATLIEDDAASYARATLLADNVPLAAIVDALVPTPDFIVETGFADVRLQAYAIGYAPGPPAWQLSGNGKIRSGRIRVTPLIVPIRDIAGRLHFNDGLLASEHFAGSTAGIPLSGEGAVQLIGGVRLALAANQRGSLERERALFEFSKSLPVSGPFAATVRLDGPPSDIRVGGSFEAHDASYANASIHLLRGALFFNARHMTLSALDLAHGGGRLWANGDIDLGAIRPTAQVVITAALPSRGVPVVANLNPGGIARGYASIVGPLSQPRGGGFAQVYGGNGVVVQTMFSAGPQRVTLGPLLYRAGVGQMRLDLSVTKIPNAKPALFGEVVAFHAPLHIIAGTASLADVQGTSVTMQSLDTNLDGVAYATSRGKRPDVAIDARATNLAYADIQLGDAALVAAGRNGRAHIVRATLDSAGTHASGQGNILFSPLLQVDAAALTGAANAGLSTFTHAYPALRAQGSIQGHFWAANNGGRWMISTQAHSPDATIAGLPVRSGSVTLDSASSSLVAGLNSAGGDVWAMGTLAGSSDSGAPHKIVAGTQHINLAALARYGVPLASGWAVGTATLRGSLAKPDITAAAAINSSYAKVPVSGDLDVAYRDLVVRSNASRIVYNGTQATISGKVSDVALAGPYAQAKVALDVRLREGDLSLVNGFTHHAAPLTGSLDGDLRLGGTLSQPHIEGFVSSDQGTLQGVAFNDLKGRLRARPGAIALEQSSVRLGASTFALRGDASKHNYHIAGSSPHVDMADFNDFFGGADVFGGTGNFVMQVASSAAGLEAGGNFELDRAALGGYPLGSIDAVFSSGRGKLLASMQQSGPAGTSQASGTVGFRQYISGRPNFATATYNVKARLRDLDLARALPLIHQQDFGIIGKLDAQGTIRGTLQRPIAAATFAVHGGQVRKMRIDAFSGTLRSDSNGVEITGADLKLPYLSARGQGRYVFLHRGIAAKVTAQSADLASVANALRAPGSVAGSANASVSVSGTVDHPKAAATLDAGHAIFYGIAFDQARVHAAYGPGELSIGDTSLTFAGQRGQLTINGELPVQLKPLALGPKERPVEFAIQAKQVDLSVLNPLVSRYGTLGGKVNALVTLSGKAGNPSVGGAAQIRHASAHSTLETDPLTEFSADLVLDHDTINLRAFHGNVGSGSIDALGSAHIVPAVGLRSTAGLQYWTRISLHHAQVDVPQWIKGTFDGQFSLTRSGVTPYAEGNLGLSDAIVPFSAIYELATGVGSKAGPQTQSQAPGVPPLEKGHTIVYGGGVWGVFNHTLTSGVRPQPSPTGFVLPSVDLNVAVKAGNNVRVKGGSAVDLTATGGIMLGGNLTAPTLAGQFTAIRGQVGYFDTTFRLIRGTVTFDPTAGLLPTLDATAVTNIGGEQITLTLSGRVDNLSTELSSNPPMTQDQIVATLLHAPQVSSLTNSPGQAQATLLSTAQGYFTAQLSRSLLFPFESALAQQLDVEQISFIFDQYGSLAVEVRKRFTPSITALYRSTLNVPATRSYGVSYRLRDFLALELLQSQPNAGTGNTLVNLRYSFH